MNATLDSTTTALELERADPLAPAQMDMLAPIEGVMTGLLTGGVLWLALASFIFALLRGARLFTF